MNVFEIVWCIIVTLTTLFTVAVVLIKTPDPDPKIKSRKMLEDFYRKTILGRYRVR